MNAGVRVFLYQKGYLHAKTISIDSSICSIGSANIDIRSFRINYELNAVLYSDRLARELEQAFERDLVHCTEFDATAYKNRNVALRFSDSVARLFSPLLCAPVASHKMDHHGAMRLIHLFVSLLRQQRTIPSAAHQHRQPAPHMADFRPS